MYLNIYIQQKRNLQNEERNESKELFTRPFMSFSRSFWTSNEQTANNLSLKYDQKWSWFEEMTKSFYLWSFEHSEFLLTNNYSFASLIESYLETNKSIKLSVNVHFSKSSSEPINKKLSPSENHDKFWVFELIILRVILSEDVWKQNNFFCFLTLWLMCMEYPVSRPRSRQYQGVLIVLPFSIFFDFSQCHITVDCKIMNLNNFFSCCWTGNNKIVSNIQSSWNLNWSSKGMSKLRQVKLNLTNYCVE